MCERAFVGDSKADDGVRKIVEWMVELRTINFKFSEGRRKRVKWSIPIIIDNQAFQGGGELAELGGKVVGCTDYEVAEREV